MTKFIYGPITNPKTGEAKDIVVSTLDVNNVRDFVIGGGIVMIGISYLAFSAFRNGADAYDRAEFNTLKALHLFEN